jgi:hypothetical protein
MVTTHHMVNAHPSNGDMGNSDGDMDKTDTLYIEITCTSFWLLIHNDNEDNARGKVGHGRGDVWEDVVLHQRLKPLEQTSNKEYESKAKHK